MSLPTGEVQTAAIARYRGDITLQGLLGSPTNPPGAVFEATGVPTNAPFPFLVVSPITGQLGTLLALGSDGVDCFLQVAALTQANGFANARAIMKQVYALTHKQALTLADGFTNCLLLFENEQEAPQSDGMTQMITHRYKVMVSG